MASIWDISHAPEITWSEIEHIDLGRVTLTAAPHLLPKSELLRAESAPPFVRELQERMHAPPALQLYTVHDTTVSSIGMAFKGDMLIHAPDISPPYVANIFKENPGLFHHQVEITRHIDRIACIFHVQRAYYGHFLLEMLPKIWVMSEIANQIGNPPIALPTDTPDYMIEMMRAFHPDASFIRLDAAGFRAERTYLPSMANLEYRYHSGWIARLRSYAVACEMEQGPGPSKIYLTRAGWNDTTFPRTIENEAEITNLLLNRGFTIIAPHELDLKQKAATFSSAHTIIGEFGSGLHNTIMSGSGARIIAFNWCNEVQQRLAQSCGHVLSILLPTDGRPRRPSDPGASDTSYTIDLVQLDETLKMLGIE